MPRKANNCADCGVLKKTGYGKYCRPCSFKHNSGVIKAGDKRNLGIKRSEEYKHKMSEVFKGIRRSIRTEFKYKNGNGYRHLLYKGILNRICVECGENNLKRLHVHHIDENRSNNEIDNLMVLCRPCHLALHGRQERVYVEGRKQINFL